MKWRQICSLSSNYYSILWKCNLLACKNMFPTDLYWTQIHTVFVIAMTFFVGLYCIPDHLHVLALFYFYVVSICKMKNIWALSGIWTTVASLEKGPLGTVDYSGAVYCLRLVVHKIVELFGSWNTFFYNKFNL